MKSKKALAIVLAIAMLFGVVSMASAASSVAGNGFADSQDSKQANSIAFLKAYGVLRGDAGTNNVRPNDALTREEFVVMVTRATGTESLAEGLAGFKPNFTDAAQISDWAVGAVNLATGQGWIKGYEDGTFRPKGNLTMAEAITVLVRATGHELKVSSVAVWPIGHIMAAREAGITNGVTLNANAAITRADMARLTYNSLFVASVKRDDDGKVVAGPPLVNALSAVVAGRVADVDTADSEIAIEPSDGAGGWDPAVPHDLAESVTVIGANSLVGLKGLTVRAVKNVDGELHIIEVTTGSASAAIYDKPGGKPDARTMVLSDGKSIKVDTGTAFYFNEDTVAVTAGDDDELEKILDGSFATAALQKGDEIVATINASGVATEVLVLQLDVQNLIVTAVQKADDDNPAVITAKLFDTPGTKDFTVAGPVLINGEAATGDDIKVGDVIDVATLELDGFDDTDALKIRATRNVVTGTVESNRFTAKGANYVATTTLKLEDGSTKSYTWLKEVAGPAPTVDAAKGTVAVLVLNAGGNVLLNDAAAAKANYAKLLNVYTDGTDQFVEVDVAGTTLTYKNGTQAAPTVANLANHVNKVGELSVAANGITAFAPVETGEFDDGKVVSVSGNWVIIALDGGGTIAIEDAIVYAFATDDKAGAYLGVDGLSAGNTVRVAETEGVVLKK